MITPDSKISQITPNSNKKPLTNSQRLSEKLVLKLLCDIMSLLSQYDIPLTVCYYHVTYAFHNESTLYSLPECEGTHCSKQAPYLKF